ncbi:alpha/beta hydrolase [Algoriphagus sp. CAU 1675]|uniref:alpha/beta fold hydrolase n=1 Tax=Algoriphagus sp. CAU 1675 TaxID=3032597 RepID=UPI0023DA3D30|nr:alpha/beta hydrolase [Algoriphagus sp. CAU 1675]MDF2157052.1 alpha/beta hydrolase [Algoriphagus sp. CAU 1675]
MLQHSKPILLVIGSERFYSKALPSSLEELFTLIHFDNLGFSHSPNYSESLYSDLNSILLDIESFRSQKQLNNFLVFGHSGHAYMALEYAKTYPQHVSALILCACSPNLHENTTQKIAGYFELEADTERKEIFKKDMSGLSEKISKNPEARFVHFALAQKAKNWFDPNFDASKLWEGVPTHLPTLDWVWGKLFHDYELNLGGMPLSCPTLLIHGKHDYVGGSLSLWDSYLSDFLHLNTKIFQKSGHYPMVEEPELFEETLISWYKSSWEKP